MQVYVSREQIASTISPPTTDIHAVRELVLQARARQQSRLAASGLVTNSEILHKNIDEYCVLDEPAERLLRSVINAKHLSLRAYHKIKKIARTIADLDDSARIGEQHIAEAVGLRLPERTVV